jgi:hypothetical protein
MKHEHELVVAKTHHILFLAVQKLDFSFLSVCKKKHKSCLALFLAIKKSCSQAAYTFNVLCTRMEIWWRCLKRNMVTSLLN